MKYALIALAALTVPLMSAPSFATTVAVWHGGAAQLQLQLVDDDDYHHRGDDDHHRGDDDHHRGDDDHSHHFDGDDASAVARHQGYQVISVKHHDDEYIVLGKRHGHLFNIEISEHGRVLSTDPVHHHGDDDDGGDDD